MSWWLLDDGPFGLLGRHFDPAWAWPAATLHLIREVAASAPRDQSGRRQKLLDMRDASGVSSIEAHDAGLSAAKILFEHLRPSEVTASRDLGEDASIAFCLAEAHEAIFVTMDKRAAYVALAELGPARVATPFDVWIWLHEQGLISTAQRLALAEATRKQDQGLTRLPYRLLT